MKRLVLFLSAYAPLLGILCPARFTTGWLVWLCAVGALVGVGLTLGVLAGPYAEGVPIDVVRTDDVGEQAFTYLLTCCPAFRSNQRARSQGCARICPVLRGGCPRLRSVRYAAGANPSSTSSDVESLRATTKSGRCVLVVSRRRLLPGELKKVHEITAGIYLAEGVADDEHRPKKSPAPGRLRGRPCKWRRAAGVW